MTFLCVPIFVTELAKARRDIALAAEAGADMAELRLDHMATENGVIDEILSQALLPFILTCRPTSEGGFSALTDAQRLEMLTGEQAPTGCLIDWELQSAREFPVSGSGRWIVSFHDFQGRPPKLYNLINEMNQLPADVNKIVWHARTIRDNLEALELLQTRSRPTIALCMGEAGIISRVLAKKFGAFLTFASLDATESTAPGQITIADMKKLYRWDAIGAATKVFGVVASPVRHSMSPAIHNAAFDAVGYDGVYLPMLVEPSYESFKAFIESFMALKGLDLSGLSITIPHKENALRYLREKGGAIEELADRIGAVNTIAFGRDGGGAPKLSGTNTDYAAILDSITTKLGIDRKGLAGLRVGVFGAGGTGRTAVAALAHYGAHVLIYNRTPSRAQALADELNGHLGKVVSVEMTELLASKCDVWINTSSVGMHPNVDESPLGNAKPMFTPQSVVFDTVYNPIKTRLLTQAESCGAKIIGGVEMFVRQAAAQFETWTHQSAPTDVMRQIVEKRLGSLA
ncbi:MAG: shikimate dehydrogenase [Planctomycetota bacterium]|nr:shikimate dehydrogenase [Planctomycetota bacterium]